MKTKIISFIAIFVLIMAGAGAYILNTNKASAPAHSNTPVAVDCETLVGDWDSTKRKGDGSLSSGKITEVRTGQHECFDRIVFDINSNEKVSYRAEYVPVVTSDGSGLPVEVAGDAAIQLVIDAWAVDPKPSDFKPDSPWKSLYEVKNAGSFEGLTTFGIGVKAEKPFDIYHLAGKDKTSMRIVLDIAH